MDHDGGDLRLLRRFLVVVLGLLFFSVSPLTCQPARQQNYQTTDLDALQAVWGAWNQSTPELSSNLAGWNSSQQRPCNQYITGGIPSWRGVQCITNINCADINATGKLDCYAFITGLNLNNASIVGILPEDIGNISILTTLELTGNPNLTGTIPNRLQSTQLITLDLHNNAFYGEIPDFGSFEWPVTVDLSGNRLNGSNPLDRIGSMKYLQRLNLGRNEFEGNISSRFFNNMVQLVQLDLSNNRFTGNLPTLSMIKNLQTLDMSHNRFTGTLPNLAAMSSLLSVDLSRNNLSGTLPSLNMIKNFQTLNLSRNGFTGPVLFSSGIVGRENTSLSVVDLSHNQLTAALDSWRSSELGTLQELYLDFNHINGTLNIGELYFKGLLRTKSANSSGLLRVFSAMNNTINNVVYDGMNIEEVTTIFRLEGNPYCNVPDSNDGRRCFCKQICFNSDPMSNEKDTYCLPLTFVTIVSFFSLGVLLFAVICAMRWRLVSRIAIDKNIIQLQSRNMMKWYQKVEPNPTIFNYSQLTVATRNFHPDMKLLQSAYGAAYKGELPDRSLVAVMQLSPKHDLDIHNFLTEVVLLSRMKHRHLVKLRGFCIMEQRKLLVDEYVGDYDVDHILLAAGSNKALLKWSTRLNICLGVASGLHYLHEAAHPKLIHRNLMASNVLLTKDYESKLADFGLAFLFPDILDHIRTAQVAGNRGYLAPEYEARGQLSDKVDVFSFGVLCLEIISGRRNVDEKQHPNQVYLSVWAWKLHRAGALMHLVDPTLRLQDSEKWRVQHVINVALMCIQTAAKDRPSMGQVLSMLLRESDPELILRETENEEYLETIRLRNNISMSNVTGLITVSEDDESISLMNSPRHDASAHSDASFLFPTSSIEMNHVKVR